MQRMCFWLTRCIQNIIELDTSSAEHIIHEVAAARAETGARVDPPRLGAHRHVGLEVPEWAAGPRVQNVLPGAGAEPPTFEQLRLD